MSLLWGGGEPEREIITFLIASEYKAWMLYYCLPALNGILPAPYHLHLAQLVCSMHILLSQEISQRELLLVEATLHRFCFEFEQLYGKIIIN